MAEEGHYQITEFSKEAIPAINMMLEDLFCQYGVSMPFFLLEFDFPDYSERPEWATGYSFNLDWGPWGYYLVWFNDLLGLLFDEAGLPRWQMPDFSPASWNMFNSKINELYESTCLRFGKTTIGGSAKFFSVSEGIWACKYEACKAGTLQSISACLGNSDVTNENAKCAIYDSSLDMLTNGSTEEKEIPANTEYGWITFNFSTAPTITTSTDYWLIVAASNASISLRNDSGDTNQAADSGWEYNGLPDPLVPMFYYNYEFSIYATYT